MYEAQPIFLSKNVRIILKKNVSNTERNLDKYTEYAVLVFLFILMLLEDFWKIIMQESKCVSKFNSKILNTKNSKKLCGRL